MRDEDEMTDEELTVHMIASLFWVTILVVSAALLLVIYG